jgi:hypothetical protein
MPPQPTANGATIPFPMAVVTRNSSPLRGAREGIARAGRGQNPLWKFAAKSLGLTGYGPGKAATSDVRKSDVIALTSLPS